jgi:thioredoxin-dependent peroxiredoxin
MKKFEKADSTVIGCSADDVELLAKFRARHKLNFPLLSDPEFKTIEAYGARRMKQFLGKSFLGIVRMTFWIGMDGHVRHIWDSVSIQGHAAAVLKAIEEG